MKKMFAVLAAMAIGVAAFASGEGNVSGSFRITKGTFLYQQVFPSVTFDVASAASDQGVLAVTAIATNGLPAVTNTVPISNVTAPHYCFFRNVDSYTNAIFVTVTMRFEPGDIAVFPAGVTVFPVWATNAVTTNFPAALQYGVFSK